MTRQPGRKAEGAVRRHVVSTKVDDETLERLLLAVRLTNATKADVVREAIVAHLRPAEIDAAA